MKTKTFKTDLSEMTSDELIATYGGDIQYDLTFFPIALGIKFGNDLGAELLGLYLKHSLFL